MVLDEITTVYHLIQELSKSLGPNGDQVLYKKAVLDFNNGFVKLFFEIRINQQNRVGQKIHQKVQDKLLYTRQISTKWRISITGMDLLCNLIESDPELCPIQDSYYYLNLAHMQMYGQERFSLVLEGNHVHLKPEQFLNISVDRTPRRQQKFRYQVSIHSETDILHQDVQYFGIPQNCSIPFRGFISEIIPKKLKILLKTMHQINKDIKENNRSIDEWEIKFYALTGWKREQVGMMFFNVLHEIQNDIQQNWDIYFKLESYERPEPNIIQVCGNQNGDMSEFDAKFTFQLVVQTKCNLSAQQGTRTFYIIFDRITAIDRLQKVVNSYFDSHKPQPKYHRISKIIKKDPASDFKSV
jgi:hypothetical protein